MHPQKHSCTLINHVNCVLILHLTCFSSTTQYMGFGLSGSTTNTLMFGADPTITWVDEISGPQAVDYHLSAYAQVCFVVTCW